jgi:hypothetical protein
MVNLTPLIQKFRKLPFSLTVLNSSKRKRLKKLTEAQRPLKLLKTNLNIIRQL